MKSWEWTGGLVLVVLLGCMGAAAGPRKAEGKRVAEPNIELRVKAVERTAQGLALTYEVHNRGDQAVWLLDRLFDTAPTGHVQLAPDKAYVALEDGRVTVSRMLHPVPEDMMVEAPEVPGVTRLPAGKTVTGRVELALPLRQSLPYASGPGKELALVEVRELRLRIGYLVDAPGLELHEGKDTQGLSYKYPSYGDAVTGQKVLESGPLAVPAGKP